MVEVLRRNKGVIIFYIVLAIATLVIVNDAKMEGLEVSNSSFAYINK